MKFSRPTTALVSTALLVALLAGSASAADPGEPDPGFGVASLATRSFVAPFSGRVEVEQRAGGGLVVGVAVNDTFRVVGYTADGVSDPSFSSGASTVIIPGGNDVWLGNMTVLGNGKIVLVGRTKADPSQMVVARLATDGKPDTTFSGDGVALFSIPKKAASGHGVVATSRGKLVIVGDTSPLGGTRCDTAAIRVNRNGSLDRTFGKRGRVIVALRDGYNGCDGAWRVVHTGKGRVVMAGSQETADGMNTLLIALNANGTLNTGFSGDGILVMNLKKGKDDYAAGLFYRQTTLVIGIAGTWNKPGLVRLTRAGRMDKSFGTNGKSWLTAGVEFGNLQSIAPDPWGNILGTGNAAGLPAFRAEREGAPDDTAFSPTAFTANVGTTAEGSDITGEPWPSGDVVVSGAPWPDLDVAVLTRYIG